MPRLASHGRAILRQDDIESNQICGISEIPDPLVPIAITHQQSPPAVIVCTTTRPKLASLLNGARSVVRLSE
jgi:hypothetical protein